MNFLEQLLKGLKDNSDFTNNLDAYRLKETITRIITSQPTIQNANSKNEKQKKQEKQSVNEGIQEEFSAVTGVAGYGGIQLREGMSQEEIILTKRIDEYDKQLKAGNLSQEEKEKIIKKKKEAQRHLINVRKKYDNAGRYVNETISKANQIIKNLKSPKYIADEKKRKGIFKSAYYGKDDPFFDGLRELYGEEGLKGYRKDRLNAFKNISDDDVELASQRYSRVENAFTHIKSLIQLAGWVASWFILYPSTLEAGSNPLVFGAGMAVLSQIIKYPEIARNSTNFEIFLARKRIAKDLGLLEKDTEESDFRTQDYR